MFTSSATRHPRRTRSRRGAGRADPVAAPPPRSSPRLPPAAPSAPVPSGGCPEDFAHYTCSGGFWFRAAVSTTVCCPHCGEPQAW